MVPAGPAREAERTRWRAILEDPIQRARHRVAAEDGRVRGSIRLVGRGPRLRLEPPHARDGVADALVAALVDEGVAAARGEGAHTVELRLPEAQASDALLAAIARTGGAEFDGRIVFRTPLEALPDEIDSPLIWRSIHDPQTAAAMYAAASEGSGDGLGPGADPLEAVRYWFASPIYVSDVQVGALDGGDVAVISAQVDPADAWGGLTFMGLVPRARGRGLGHAVHRHGLAMLRAQGAQLYGGGTSLGNRAMRACFVRQGCREHQRLRQFRWTLAC